MKALIAKLREQRETLYAEGTSLLAGAAAESRSDLNETEAARWTEIKAGLAAFDVRMAELVDQEERAVAAAEIARKIESVPSIKVGREALTYRKDGANSYFRDMVAGNIQGDAEARARLNKHGAEMRDLTRTDGAGGDFVPPIWLMDEYAALARAGRPTANLVRNLELPPGTDTISIPLVTGGTTTAAQTADNASVSQTDMTTSNVTAGVKTIAGQQNIAIQLLEQSPVSFDQIVFQDLLADFAAKLDTQVLNGSNASGQVKGILNVTSPISVTYTSGSPTVQGLYPKYADAIQQMHTNRFLPPTVIVMHPRRWAWHLAALDSSNRPLVLPGTNGLNNALAVLGEVASQGVVGQIHGLPVVVDASIPTNLGAGTNEDRIIILRASDHYLWESSVRSRVLPDVLSGNLEVRLQVYGYCAFTAERYPKAVAIISGTGLVTPTF